jgi:hypothetical protein
MKIGKIHQQEETDYAAATLIATPTAASYVQPVAYSCESQQWEKILERIGYLRLASINSCLRSAGEEKVKQVQLPSG